MRGSPWHERQVFSSEMGTIGSFPPYVHAAHGEAWQGRNAQIGESLKIVNGWKELSRYTKLANFKAFVRLCSSCDGNRQVM
jgi:hypothetical protein